MEVALFTKRIGRLSMDKAIQTTTSFTQAIAKAQHAAPPKPQLKSLAAGNGSPAPVQYQNNIPSTSFNPQPALSLDKFAVPNLELNDDDQNTSLPPWYQGEGVSTDIYEGTPEDAYTPTVTLVNDTSDSDIPDADELIDDIEEANSLDLVAEEHEGLEDRDDLIDHLEGEGYEIETQDDDTSHTLEITDSETDETLLKIDERELPSGVVIEETTNADGETTTVVIDEDGNRTTLDEGQGTDREDIDDIAEDVSDGKDIDAIAEDLDLTPDQVIAQLKATGFVIISQDIYDEDGNNIGWYQKIVSQDDNEVIAVYRRSSEAPKESNDNLNLNQIDGTYETSYFIDSQGRVVELETFSPNGPVAEGHVSIETVTDENGRTTTTTRDENGETVAVTDNGYTLVTSPDGTITLHDAESDIELDIEPGGHEEALASELLELDLETEEGIIAAAEIMLLLDNDNKEGGSAVGELKDELDARNNELDEAIAEHGAGSPEAARARAAINTAYAAWLEAVAISNYRHLLLQEAALDPSATEARNNANARIDELLASYGQYVSRPSPQYTLEEVQELLEQAELEVELASEAKAEYEQAERLTVVATKEQETIYLPHHTVLIDPEGDYSLTDHAIDRSEGLAAQARVDELFSEANLHNTRGNKALADFEVSRLEQQRENAVPGTDDHSELSDALDAARTQQELASTQLEIAQSQYNLSLLNRLAYDEAEVLAEEYIEEFVTEEGYFDKHDKSHEDFRFFGTHSGEYTGYTLDERDNGELWINIHYENKTRNVQLTPASGDMTPWWRENRNSELISQWHETFENRENAQRGVYEATIPLYEALETQADDRIAELESKLTEQQELFGPPSIEAPENATPEHELVGLEGLPLQVPPQIAEQYAARGLDALLESGLPVRIMTDTINQSNQGWIQSSDNWQWVQPEMAHTMLELQELNIEKQNLKSAIEIQNGLSVLPLQLLGESNAEYEARAAYDSLDDTHREQTLDTIYQPRFQELLGQQQFNQEFEQLEGAALEARVLNTLGGEINNKQLREIMDEIHDIGGESPEIAGIPVFYVDQSGNQLQTALLAVRDKDDNVLYVDVTGRHYDDVEDFQNNNRQFQESGRLVIPQGFDTTPNEGGDIPLDVIDARNPSELETVVDPLVGFSSTAATVASFTPAAPVAAPLAFAGMLYMGIRQGFNQKDHIQHGGDWGDRESVMNSLGVVTSALPVGSSVMRTIGMVRVSGLSVGPAMDASIGALKPGTDLALNAQRYMMHSGRLNRFSRIADGAGMVGGMPLMGDTLGNLYLLGDQMSDSQKGQALLDLATGVVGTGLGARGLWTTRPNSDGAEDYNSSTTREQTDPLVPDRNMIFKHEPETAQQLPSSPEPIRLYFNPLTQQYGVKPKEIASDISTEVNDPSTEGRIASPGEGSSQDSLPIGNRNDTSHSHTAGDVSRDQNLLQDRLYKFKKAIIPTDDDRGSANLFGWLEWFKNKTNSASYNENRVGAREEVSTPVHSPEMDEPNNSVLLPFIEWNSTIDQIIIPEGYKVVYRGDSRSPHEIQEADGFRRQGRESSSRVIDTTLHLTAARYYANHNIKFYGGEGWVYAIIDKDVDSSPLFADAPLPYDPAMDVPFNRDIPLESILAAQRVDEQKNLVAPVYLFTTSSQQSHPSFWLPDSARKPVNASILGAPPKSVEAIHTPPETGPHSHGDELGVRNKTHILVNEPDTGDLFIIPWMRGATGLIQRQASDDRLPSLIYEYDDRGFWAYRKSDRDDDRPDVDLKVLPIDSPIEVGSGKILADTIVVTHFDRGDLPPGSGSLILADLLNVYDIQLTRRLVFEDIINDDTLHSFNNDGEPEQTVLGRSGKRVLHELGLEPAAYRFEQTEWGINLVIDIAPQLSPEASPHQDNMNRINDEHQVVDKTSLDYRPTVLRSRLPEAAERAYTPNPDNKEPTTVFRGDARSPEEIFRHGFNAEGQPYPDGVTSTSLSSSDAKSFAIVDAYEGRTKNGWLYTIVEDISDKEIITSLPIEGHAINGNDHYEVPFFNEIPPESILAARQVDSEGRFFGPIIYNPNFKDPSRLPDDYLVPKQQITTSQQPPPSRPHKTIWLVDETGNPIEARVLGPLPESVETIYTLPRDGLQPHGDEPELSHITHLLIRDPDTGDPCVIPWVRGASEDHIPSSSRSESYTTRMSPHREEMLQMARSARDGLYGTNRNETLAEQAVTGEDEPSLIRKEDRPILEQGHNTQALEAIAARLAAPAIATQSRLAERAVETQRRVIERSSETRSAANEETKNASYTTHTSPQREEMLRIARLMRPELQGTARNEPHIKESIAEDSDSKLRIKASPEREQMLEAGRPVLGRFEGDRNWRGTPPWRDATYSGLPQNLNFTDSDNSISRFQDSLFEPAVRDPQRLKTAIEDAHSYGDNSVSLISPREREQLRGNLEQAWRHILFSDDDSSAPTTNFSPSDYAFLRTLVDYVQHNRIVMYEPRLKLDGHTAVDNGSQITYRLYHNREELETGNFSQHTEVGHFLERLLSGSHFVARRASGSNGDFYGLLGNSAAGDFTRRATGHSHYRRGVALRDGLVYPNTVTSDKAPETPSLLSALLIGRTQRRSSSADTFFQLEGWPARGLTGIRGRHGQDFTTHRQTGWNLSTYGASPFSEKRGLAIFLQPETVLPLRPAPLKEISLSMTKEEKSNHKKENSAQSKLNSLIEEHSAGLFSFADLQRQYNLEGEFHPNTHARVISVKPMGVVASIAGDSNAVITTGTPKDGRDLKFHAENLGVHSRSIIRYPAESYGAGSENALSAEQGSYRFFAHKNMKVGEGKLELVGSDPQLAARLDAQISVPAGSKKSPKQIEKLTAEFPFVFSGGVNIVAERGVATTMQGRRKNLVNWTTGFRFSDPAQVNNLSTTIRTSQERGLFITLESSWGTVPVGDDGRPQMGLTRYDRQFLGVKRLVRQLDNPDTPIVLSDLGLDVFLRPGLTPTKVKVTSADGEAWKETLPRHIAKMEQLIRVAPNIKFNVGEHATRALIESSEFRQALIDFMRRHPAAVLYSSGSVPIENDGMYRRPLTDQALFINELKQVDKDLVWSYLRGNYESLVEGARSHMIERTQPLVKQEIERRRTTRGEPGARELQQRLEKMEREQRSQDETRNVARAEAFTDFDDWLHLPQERNISQQSPSETSVPYPTTPSLVQFDRKQQVGVGTPWGVQERKFLTYAAAFTAVPAAHFLALSVGNTAEGTPLGPLLVTAGTSAGVLRGALTLKSNSEQRFNRLSWERMTEKGQVDEQTFTITLNRFVKLAQEIGATEQDIRQVVWHAGQMRSNIGHLQGSSLPEAAKVNAILAEVRRFENASTAALGFEPGSLNPFDTRTQRGRRFSLTYALSNALSLAGYYATPGWGLTAQHAMNLANREKGITQNLLGIISGKIGSNVAQRNTEIRVPFRFLGAALPPSLGIYLAINNIASVYTAYLDGDASSIAANSAQLLASLGITVAGTHRLAGESRAMLRISRPAAGDKEMRTQRLAWAFIAAGATAVATGMAESLIDEEKELTDDEEKKPAGDVEPSPSPTPSPSPSPSDQPEQDASQQFAVTAPSGLNLRSRPSAEALIVTVFPHGTVLEEAGSQETDASDISWTYVTGQDLDGNTQEGWVATRYIEVEEEQPA